LQYINTGLLVSDKGLRTTYGKSGKKQIEISDRRVIKECLDRINLYAEKMNLINAKGIDCKTLVEILTDKNTELSFTEYANEFIRDMQNRNRDRPAQNYRLALKRLQEFTGKENIYFNDLTSKVINGWIDSMKDSARKKSLYPSCVRSVFNSAIRKYNDYDYDMIRIRTNPFIRVKIPKEKAPEKRSVEAEVLNRLFLSETSFPSYDGISRMELARDVSFIIFCLAGINAADLYDMKKSSLSTEWKLCYNRKKTRDKSDTGAYIEILVPAVIRPLFEKYRGGKDSLFIFSTRFSDENRFVKTVNKGLKSLCDDLHIQETVTTYTFRHSWATIAQNQCGASTELVAFSLNHSSAHRVTEGYIRKDYSPIDALNAKVIDFVLVQTLIVYIPLYALAVNLKKK
jgi:site-specific recombinase XerD